jgi:hypothetical protein
MTSHATKAVEGHTRGKCCRYGKSEFNIMEDTMKANMHNFLVVCEI